MPDPIRSRPTPWTQIILVCGKCSRKLDGGFGAKRDKTLRTALNDQLRENGQRRSVRVVETKCFGICPKKAVMVLGASRPGYMLTVPRGTGAAEMLRQLAGEASLAQKAQ